MLRRRRNRNIIDNTMIYNGVGPGNSPYSSTNVGFILQQAISESWGRGNNPPILLPRKFEVKAYCSNSCDIIRRSCIRVIENVNYEQIYRASISTPWWKARPGPKFFLSHDEEYVIKILRPEEYKVFKQILPELSQFIAGQIRTLLPRIFGLYSFKSHGKKLYFVVMNNILPSTIFNDQIYDLKGVTNRRGAGVVGMDFEFQRRHPRGLTMNQAFLNRVDALMISDCTLLRQIGLTNYSLLVGIHEVAQNETKQAMRVNTGNISNYAVPPQDLGLLRFRDRALGIPGQSVSGPVLICIGIIDIQQPFNLTRKLKHFFKSIVANQRTLSILPPLEYELRFTASARTWFR